jgi:signal transduction histidine kinase
LQEAVSQMEEFSYSVSHDLRAPLRAMQGYASALLEDYRGKAIDAEAEEYLQRIVNAGLRMDRLTRDVLVYSRIPRANSQLQGVALDKLVSDIVQQYRQEKSNPADIAIEAPLLPVMGNESFLAQAISNLVDNAVKFTPADRVPHVRVWTESNQGKVRLWVEDNGIGILPEHQKRIWGMFERVHPQTKFEGTGIGLAIVRKTIERMNGTVGVISDGIAGSKFWIQLPGI